jgi:hypothetical protein
MGKIIVDWIITLSFGFLVYYFYKTRKKKKVTSDISKEVIPVINSEISESNSNFLSLMPKFEILPEDVSVEQDKVHEISDKIVINRLNKLVPQIVNGYKQFADKKVVEHIKQIENNNVFQVIIPEGAKLYKSKDLAGAFRGGYSVNGQLAGQANLVPIKNEDAKDLSLMADTTATVMNVASMVVGQYYMSEINDKMGKMLGSLDKIADFQQMEFKARILSLINKVGKISQFNVEIIENEEIRKRTLDNLSRHEDEATELLQQVNLSIENLVSKNKSNDFEQYRDNIHEFDKLITYQQYLLSILEEIGRLVYLLNMGMTSSEYCYSSFNNYIKQSTGARNQLVNWHKNKIKQFEIDLKKKRYAKQGFKVFLVAPTTWINNDWKYNELSKSVVTKIEKQSSNSLNFKKLTNDLLNKETKIISKNGKYYYLTE